MKGKDMTNYYVVGNSAPKPDLTGTPYEGYKVVTEDEISSPYSSNPNWMQNGDNVVISGSVDSDVVLQPSNDVTDGYDLHVTILDNTHNFNVSHGIRVGGTLNYTEPNLTVDVTGDAKDVSVGYGNRELTLKLNLSNGSAIGDIRGSDQSQAQLIIKGGDNVRIGNVKTHDGSDKSDSIILGENSRILNVELGEGNDTFQVGAGSTVGTLNTGGGNDNVTLGDRTVISDITVGKGQNTIQIGAGSQTGNITGGDDNTDTVNLTVGDGSKVGDIVVGTSTSSGEYGGNDTITLGNNVTAGQISTYAGNDKVTIGNNSYTGDVSTGDGQDTVATGVGTTTGALHTGDGDDTITIQGTTTTINVGGGATNLHVTGTGTIGDVAFGGGDDTVLIDGKAGYLQGSGGNDTITVNGTATGIEGNTGDDEININGTLVQGDGTAGKLYGGYGSDKINLGDGAKLGSVDLGTGGANGDTLTGGNDILIDGNLTQDVGDHYSVNSLGDNVTITGSVNFHGGKDRLSLGENASVGGSITMGDDGSADDADVLEVGNNSVVQDYINTNRGNDTVVIGDNTTLNGGWNAINTEMGDDVIYLGVNVVTVDGNSIFTGEGWDTIYGPGAGNTTTIIVDGGTVVPNGDNVKIRYQGDAEREELKQALEAQGWRADANGVYTHPDSSNATFIYKGITYKNIWKVDGVPCFARGTLIRTDGGDVAIEDLSAGDLVLTADHGLQPIRWIGTSPISAETLSEKSNLRPIRICAGALGQNSPASDLIVSPQHRVLVRSKIAQKMFGTDEVLVAAKQLLQIDGIDIATDMAEVEYFHMLFDQHEVVLSNGAETESLFTGPEALKSVGREARAEIFAIFPQLCHDDYEPSPARPLASGRMGRKLAVRHMRNNKVLVAH